MHTSFTMVHSITTAVIMADSLFDTISYRKKRKVCYINTRTRSALSILHIFNHFCETFPNVFAEIKFEASIHLPNVATGGDHFLYTTRHNYVDLNADDNGIWAIYTTAHSSHTNVVKVCGQNLARRLFATYLFTDACSIFQYLFFFFVVFYFSQLDARTLTIQYGWNISINHNKVKIFKI